jgi:DNA binding protein with HTH domain
MPRPRASGHWLEGPVAVELAETMFPPWLRRANLEEVGSIRILVCRPAQSDPGKVLQIVEVERTPREPESLLASLREESGAFRLIAVRSAESKLLLWMIGPTPALCSRVFETGGLCLRCAPLTASPMEGRDRRCVVLPDAVAARRLVQRPPGPRRTGPSVLRIGQLRGSQALSLRQDAAFEAAARSGFFSTPRRSTLADLARELGVSRSAAMGLLRRGIEKLAVSRLRTLGPREPRATPEGPPESTVLEGRSGSFETESVAPPP